MSFQDHPLMDLETTLLSRPWLKKAKNQLLSRPLQIELKTLTPDTWSPLMRRVKSFQILSPGRRHNQSQNSHPVVHHLRDQDSTQSMWSQDQCPSTVPGIFGQVLFSNSFDCIGDMQGEYDIKTDPTIPPVQHGRWKVPIKYKEEIEKELAEMVQQGIIIKQTEPTPWVSSLTYPKKANGKLRICLDPKDLNKAIISENHKAPTLKEIAHVLTGATKFSKVDGNKAFFGMHLTEEASLLTMFNTHLRRYRFLCVPFGMSQDIFQMRMDDIVAQCPGVLAIHDDVFIYGKHDRDHNANIINLFNVAQKEGLVFNSKKCAIEQESIMFFGGVFSAEGYSPDPEKIQGISEMTPPQMKQELQSFLGAVNYLQTFIPHLSSNTEPLQASSKRRTALPGMRISTHASRK